MQNFTYDVIGYWLYPVSCDEANPNFDNINFATP